MATSDQDREQELAELLREVRALRQTIDELKVDVGLRPKLPPNYEVLVRTRPALHPTMPSQCARRCPPNYAVARFRRSRPSMPSQCGPSSPSRCPHTRFS